MKILIHEPGCRIGKESIDHKLISSITMLQRNTDSTADDLSISDKVDKQL